jgi:hypothetical protein
MHDPVFWAIFKLFMYFSILQFMLYTKKGS